MDFNSRTKRLGLFIANALLMCCGAAAGDGFKYLPTVGPGALRFSTASPQYDPSKVLPALKMGDEVTTNTVDTISKPEEAIRIPPETAPVFPEPRVRTAAPVETAEPPQTPTPSPETSDGRTQITPQMLLRYFNQDGSREVVVPTGVEFTPPPPASGTRSSAVYTSPPAR